MASLYDIAEAIEAVSNMVDEDGVLLPEAEAAFDELQMEKEQKFENIAKLIKNLNADAEACKIEKARLDIKKKNAENKVERLKAYLKFVMEKSKQSDYKAGLFSFKIQEFASVVVADVSKLPVEFQNITIEPKKKDLADAMKL